jgi:hypothetical protein
VVADPENAFITDIRVVHKKEWPCAAELALEACSGGSFLKGFWWVSGGDKARSEK